ncbi:D-alanyl-D-alanine carboxypeptidase [Patescibacteria group bacterium]|nr:D-alanyl-D-alanine carboxypeptidase [Patescibacteria group bacterium]
MINKRSIRIFLISLFLTFLMGVIPRLGFRTTWVSPVPKAQNTLERIKPKLDNKPNRFYLRKELIPTVAAGAPYEQASAYGLVDLDSGEVIASKNLSQKLPMASLTKIMTSVVALDLAKPQDKFIVSQQAASEIPTKVMLKPGEELSLEKLLDATLISSANDSAQAIKDGIDEKFGEGTFIQAMNSKAQIIGLKNTHFTNVQGFDNLNHYSSVEDLSLLSAYALKQYPEISQIVSTQQEDLTNNGTDLRFYLNNWNGLLGVYPGTMGIKIGNTENAGYCTIVASQREGKKLLAIILGAPGVLERDLWASQLLDLGFNKQAGLSPVNITENQLKAKYASWKYFE